MNLLQIECFLAVAQYNSFTQASRARFISQPTLSKHIKNIETELGIQLFDRSGPCVTLTSAGELYYSLFNHFMNELAETKQKVKEMNNPYFGTLKIGFINGQIFPEKLMQALYHFKEQYPNVNLIFESHHFDTILLELQNGTLDAIIHFHDFISTHEYLNFLVLFEIQKYLIYSKQLPILGQKESPTMMDFRSCDFFVPASTQSNHLRIKLIKTCQLYGFSPHIVTLPNAESVLSNVEFGSGVALSDELNKDINRRDLKQITINPPNQVCLAWQKNFRNESVQLLAECLKQAFTTPTD